MWIERRHRRAYLTAALATVASTGAVEYAPGELPVQGVLPLWRYTTELSLELAPVRTFSGSVGRAVQVVANARGQMFVVHVPGAVTLLAPDGAIVGQTVLLYGWRAGVTAGSVGDSLWVWDPERNMVSVFAPSRDLPRRDFPVGDTDAATVGGIRLPAMMLNVRAVYGDGSVLAEGRSKDEVLRATAFDGRGIPLVRVARNRVREIVDWIPVASTRPDLLLAGPNVPRDSRGRAGALVHAGWSPSVDGSYVSTVQAAFQGPTANRLRTTTMSAEGDTLFSHATYPFSLIPVAQSPTSYYSLRPYKPPVRDAFPAANGSVMISMEAESREGDQEYLVFDATGTPRARVRLPFLIAVSQFEGNSVWGYWANKTPDTILRLRLHPAGG
jgi:hypothetical protein